MEIQKQVLCLIFGSCIHFLNHFFCIQYGFHMRVDQAKNIVIHIFSSDSVSLALLSSGFMVGIGSADIKECAISFSGQRLSLIHIFAQPVSCKISEKDLTFKFFSPGIKQRSQKQQQTPDTFIEKQWMYLNVIHISESYQMLLDRKSTRLNSSHSDRSRMPSSA